MIKKIVAKIIVIIACAALLSSCSAGKGWAKADQSEIEAKKYEIMETAEFDRYPYYDAIEFLLSADSKDGEKLETFYTKNQNIISEHYYNELKNSIFLYEEGENDFSEALDGEGIDIDESVEYPIYDETGAIVGYGTYEEYQSTVNWYIEAPSARVVSADFYNDCILVNIFDKYCQGVRAVLFTIDSSLKITGYEVF